MHLIHGVRSLTGSNWFVNLCHFLRKYLAILSSYNGFHLRAQHLHIKAIKHTLVIQLNTAVQGNLSPKGKDNAVRTLISDHLHTGWEWDKQQNGCQNWNESGSRTTNEIDSENGFIEY